MNMDHDWQPIIDKLKSSQNVLMTTHVNPDGDGLGSEMAMYHCLTKMGLKVRIINESPLPDEYRFLDPDHVISQYDKMKHGSLLEEFDLVFTFDVGGTSRLGKIGADLAKLNIPTICIDHHPENQIVCDHKIIDEKAPATTCLIYELIKLMCPDLMDQKIAEAIFVGLMTDTGSFRFENTTARSFETAAELINLGVKPAYIHRHVYESYTPERMKLLGMTLQKVNYEFDRRLAWFTVTIDDIRQSGASLDEIGGFTDFIRSIKGVEVSVMFLEVKPDRIRINFRSKGKIIVNTIARKFGGGGHKFAAGITVKLTLKEAINQILPDVRKATKEIVVK